MRSGHVPAYERERAGRRPRRAVGRHAGARSGSADPRGDGLARSVRGAGAGRGRGRTTSAHAPSTSEDTTVVVPAAAAAEGTVVDRENEKNSAEYDEDAAATSARTTPRTAAGRAR
ncbi:hypothetical protein ACFQ51_09530 [Streptomyces kaempferi]